MTTTSPTATERLTAALAHQAECQQAIPSHHQTLHNLTERKKNGADVLVTARDVREAQEAYDDAVRAKALADRAVEQARRAVPNTDTSVAEALAPMLERALDLPITVTTKRPSEVPDELPAVVVVQRNRRVANSLKGTMQGQATVLYFRNKFHSKLSGEAIERAARVAPDLRLEGDGDVMVSTDRDGGVLIDSATVRVASAFAAEPIIQAKCDDNLGAFSQVLAGVLEGFTGTASGGGVLTDANGNGSGITGGLVTGASVVAGKRDPNTGRYSYNARKTSDTISSDGVRRRTIEVELAVVPRARYRGDAKRLQGNVAQGIEKQVNRCFTSLGRVTSATVPSNEPRGRDGAAITARFEFVSRVLDSEIPTAPTSPARLAAVPSAPVKPASSARVPRQVDPTESDSTGARAGSHPGAKARK